MAGQKEHPLRKNVKDGRDGVIFKDPLPLPNLNHTTDQKVIGNIRGVDDPQCRIMGVTRDHFVTPAFAVDMNGDFTVTIPANNLWDDTLYILCVYSQRQEVYGSIFLDTRPPGI